MSLLRMRAQTTEERQDFNQGHIAQLASSLVVGNNHDLKEAGVTKESVANRTREMEETYLWKDSLTNYLAQITIHQSHLLSSGPPFPLLPKGVTVNITEVLTKLP